MSTLKKSISAKETIALLNKANRIKENIEVLSLVKKELDRLYKIYPIHNITLWITHEYFGDEYGFINTIEVSYKNCVLHLRFNNLYKLIFTLKTGKFDLSIQDIANLKEIATLFESIYFKFRPVNLENFNKKVYSISKVITEEWKLYDSYGVICTTFYWEPLKKWKVLEASYID
jgi:hypothetical protein